MAAAHVARSGLAAGLLVGLLLAGVPGSVAAAGPKGDGPRAVLDGKSIPIAEVGDHFCHDFAFPEIRCFTDKNALEAAVGGDEGLALETSLSPLPDVSLQMTLAATSGVTYVTIYDYAYYQGSYMYLSQDYWSLAAIGWNDRVGSFIVRNSQSGAFYTDWMYSGTQYNFCCNSAVASLGAYDNSFSSVNQN